ncbi:MAG: hypothetical protein U0414_13605 [Polyangiaceae bacterium]
MSDPSRAILITTLLASLAGCAEDDVTTGAGGASTGAGSTAASTSASVSTSASAATTGASSASTGTGPGIDLDLDGIDDATEAMLAAAYRPYLSYHGDEACSLGGIVYRVHPHPKEPGRIHIVYDHLFETDCGAGGHVGDNEAFGVTIDPAVPPPAGILSLVAIGHQGTLCEQVSTCGQCAGADACALADLGGTPYPVVFTSKDKHASYVAEGGCGFTNCFDQCEITSPPADAPMVNVGEPGAPLVTDLTDQGFITAVNGWTEMELFHVDPWDTTKDFGGAGNVADDLVDLAFVPPACP